MNRPDLTYLTQNTFVTQKLDYVSHVRDNQGSLVALNYLNEESEKYIKPISKIPDLVQCAEMLFDMTKEGSMTHIIVGKLLNELKQD